MATHNFIRFTDFGLKDFAVSGNIGGNFAKSNRLLAFEKQAGNPIIQYPAGIYAENGITKYQFANDSEATASGVFDLGRNVRKATLKGAESRCISFFEQLVIYAKDSGIDGSELESYANVVSVAVPEYTVTAYLISANRLEVFCQPDNANKYRTLVLCCNIQSGQWVFQWFISDLGNVGMGSLYDNYAATLPLAPDPNGFTFQAKFWDLDYVDFSEVQPDQFRLPIKSGDQYRINLLPDENNLDGIESGYVGMVDSEGNVIDEFVGTFAYPTDTNCISVVFPYYSVNGAAPDYVDWQDFIDALNGLSGDDLVMALANQSANFTGTTAATLIQDSIVEDNYAAFSELTWSNDPQDFIDKIASLANVDVIGEVIPVGETFRVRITFCFPECQPGINAIPFYFISPGSGETIFVTYQESLNEVRTVPTQLQCNITVPTLADGCYQFYLHDGYSGKVYAFSNPVELDSMEQFSRLISFSGNNIAQGFEYLSGWSQQFRVPLNGGAPEIKLQDSSYRDSRGNYRRPSQKSDIAVNLHTSWIDEQTLQAFFGATQHAFLVWDRKSIFTDGDLEVGHPQDFSTETSYSELSQLKFRAILQNSQPIDNGCSNC